MPIVGNDTSHRASPPADKGNTAGQDGAGAGLHVPCQRNPALSALVCWRCGVPFAWTTDEDLKRCTELARSAA